MTEQPSTLMTVLYIAVPIILGVSLLLGLLSFIFSMVKKKLWRVVDEQFENRDIVMKSIGANFFGMKSAGHAQIRGNGALILTNDKLWFRLAYPARTIEIPVSAIKRINIVRSFMGKSAMKRLIRVDFDLGQGPDAAAWMVRAPHDWHGTIETMVYRNGNQ